MATYSIVDEAYDVEVAKSVKYLFERYDLSNMFLDDWNEKPVTVKSLTDELNEFGIARLYVEGYNDWKYKIQKH